MSSELYLNHERAGTAARQIARHGEDYGGRPGNGTGPIAWGDTSLISGFVSTLNDCPVAEVRQLLAARITQTGDNLGKSIDRIADAEDAGRRAISSLPEAS
jgi:hypothetical protein